MGSIIGKLLRKKKSTMDILEELENEIRIIEDFRRDTEQAHRKIVGRFMLFSVLIYLIIAFLFYFYCFPATIYERLLYIIPLLLAPVIILSVKRILTWYYNQKISRNQNKLKILKDEKRKVLDKVMETETYKTAKAILEKFAPEHTRRNTISSSSLELTPSRTHTGITSSSAALATPGLRQRMLPSAGPPARASFGGTPLPGRNFVGSTTSLAVRGSMSTTPGTAQQNIPNTSLPMPRVILPRDRSVLDKMVDYLVGDGPSNRYALICNYCNSHNGMAVREEFEYIAFRCCYCYAFNPARKKKPEAPKLDFEKAKLPNLRRFSSSDSDKNSPSDPDSDSDEENAKPRISEVNSASDTIAKTSDNEKTSDYDKLSDLENKSSDIESSRPAQGDGAAGGNPKEEEPKKHDDFGNGEGKIEVTKTE